MVIGAKKCIQIICFQMLCLPCVFCTNSDTCHRWMLFYPELLTLLERNKKIRKKKKIPYVQRSVSLRRQLTKQGAVGKAPLGLCFLGFGSEEHIYLRFMHWKGALRVKGCFTGSTWFLFLFFYFCLWTLLSTWTLKNHLSLKHAQPSSLQSQSTEN